MEQPIAETVKRAATPGSFRRGDSRINRAGRPKRGLALAEIVRKHTDVHEVIAFLTSVMRDIQQPLELRLRACELLTLRGWGHPIPADDLERIQKETAK